MRAVVCAKEVLDPDAVNNYALEGRLVIGEDGKSLTQTTIPRLMNAYDEQAIEAVLRLRDAGVDVKLTVVAVGARGTDMLKHALSLGADEVVIVPTATPLDCFAVAQVLAAYIRKSGGADLVLCGRQASDDDQGVVPGLLAEFLDMPVVTVARAIEHKDGAVRVTRATPDGDEVVEVLGAAIITVSNELGTPRYPTMQAKLKARKATPTEVTIESLGLSTSALAPKVELIKQFVPTVRSGCEILDGGSPAEVAGKLIERLRQDGVL
ncbi:MAG TPA: electron transfer flavoprotein subunit beta/FixA family protein [Candidatus Binatia bacterium]|nr:electron transfer flavoprotein subunit beta/FixA family protein [Candidatus Binatia bacterium]